MARPPVEISAVVVHYRAAELAAQAVHRLRGELAGFAGGSEILVVDNGSDAADREVLGQLPVRLLEPGENLGYAGGLNHGAAVARGRSMLLMNPDVLVLPGCCGALAAALADGAAAAGPRFFWDHGRRLRLPPPEATTRRDLLLRALAPRLPRAAGIARRRWRFHARRQWLASAPYPTPHLSGALLAVRRDVWDRVGPFDEGYRLYFEETEWLHRLGARGFDSHFVPAAEAIHLYDASGRVEPRSREWFAASARRFRRLRFGRLFAALLDRVERLAPARAEAMEAGRAAADGRLPPGRPRLDLALPPGLAPGPCWVEISPNPLGFPAAAEEVPTGGGRLRWELPEEIWRRLEPHPHRLAVVDATGTEWAVFRVDPAAAMLESARPATAAP